MNFVIFLIVFVDLAAKVEINPKTSDFRSVQSF